MQKIGYYLEDDVLLRMSAEFRAKEQGLTLKTFSNSNEFIAAICRLPNETPLFFDSNIGEGLKGEQIAEYCFELGYKNLFLITSYDKEDFPEMPWLKDIGRKEDIFKFWNGSNKSLRRKL